MASTGDQVSRVMISSWTFASLSALFLGLRIFCKFKSRRNLWWDDYVLIASWVSILRPDACLRCARGCADTIALLQVALFASVLMTTITVPLGLGKHAADVPPYNLGEIGLRGNINGTFSVLAAAWSKTSFALTLLRLMGTKKWTSRFLWFAIATMNVFLLGNALFQWIKCWPISKTWDVMEAGTCWPAGVQTRYGMFAAGNYHLGVYSESTQERLFIVSQGTLLGWTLSWPSCLGSWCGHYR